MSDLLTPCSVGSHQTGFRGLFIRDLEVLQSDNSIPTELLPLTRGISKSRKFILCFHYRRRNGFSFV